MVIPPTLIEKLAEDVAKKIPRVVHSLGTSKASRVELEVFTLTFTGIRGRGRAGSKFFWPDLGGPPPTSDGNVT